MRLLDHVVRCRTPLVPAVRGIPLRTGTRESGSFGADMIACPLRFVLGDDLTRSSAELAFADGARLAGCLDLLRMPAAQFWIEWNDEVHKRVIHETRSAPQFEAAAAGRKAGVLLRASQDGVRAVAHTFWVAGGAEDSEVTLSPLETHIDLRGEFPITAAAPDPLEGELLHATHSTHSDTAELLDHVRFRFDAAWADYYRSAAANAAFRERLIKESVAAIAWDAPLVLGFLLLLSAKDATRWVPVSRTAINRKRAALGRAPLLDHIEVNACLQTSASAPPMGEGSGRQSPRLHHVRGHLVRREQQVFWRVPHLRGSACRGAVQSRTVCLSFAKRCS
jgi:hypothetical protein